jgi:hypothetical protein
MTRAVWQTHRRMVMGRSAFITKRRALVSVFLAIGLLFAARANAASLSVTWNAPTTNANGTALTDLSGYRLYLGTTTGSCPSSSFRAVSSPTLTPTAGQVVTTRVTGLTLGTTYVTQVTAVDSTGNESACSASVSGVAHADFSVTPTGATSFGTAMVSTTIDQTFTVLNTSSVTVAGGASVGAPFSVTAGASFSLAPGASQAVTVRFAPTTAGSFATNVNFTANGDTLSRGVSGSSTAAPTATLTVTKGGTGTGTVTSTPAGISCGTDCSETVTQGSQLVLTASPAAGSTFAGWGGACTGTATCTVTVNAATAVTATFNTVPLVTLTVTKGGTGGGTVTSNPAGISCGTDCSESVAPGASMTLTATPAAGSTFAGWGGACTGTATCTVTVNAATAVTATFNTVPLVTLTVTKGGTGGGTVTSNPAGISCGTDCSESVAPGASMTLTATPAAGSAFSGWSGACTGVATCTVTLTAATTVTATFAPTPTTTPQEIVIDNANAGVQDAAGGRTFAGTWCLSSATDQFGPNSLYSCGGTGDRYRWTPRIPAAGAYDVYVWYSTRTTRSATVPITVVSAGGQTSRLFDERTGGGRWILHGRYTFNAGTTGYVEASGANGNASADAVRLVPVATSTPPPALPGLVAAYAFDEASGTTVADASGNNNNGTLGAGVTRTTQGRFGSALAFNGTGYVSVPHSASLALTTGMTLEAWVFPTGSPTSWATALMKNVTGDAAYLLYAGSPNNAMVYVTPQGSASARVTNTAALPLNTWSHIAGTYDGTTLRFYVNGVQIGSRSVSGTLVTSSGPLTIGGNTVWGEFFQGQIDQVRIYNRALSPAEIQTDMTTPIAP